MDFNNVSRIEVLSGLVCGYVSKITQAEDGGERTLWECKVTVTYHYNADGREDTTTQRVSWNTAFTPLSQPFQRHGYNLVGWNTYEHRQSAAPDYPAGQAIQGGFSENTDLYACWSESTTGTIYFRDNVGISEQIPQQYVKNAPVTLDPNRFAVGDSVFMNWSENRDGTGRTFQDQQYVPDGFSSFETYLYAQWGYRLSVSVSHGEGSGVQTYLSGTSVGFSARPDFGYRFAGWSDGVATSAHPPVVMDRHRSYSAQCAPVSSVVTLDASPGTVYPDSLTVSFGSAYGDLPLASYDGYDFYGWRDADGYIVLPTTTVTATADHTLYAWYERNQFTVFFDPLLTGATVTPSSKTVRRNQPYGSLPTPANVPTGYNFTGWRDAAGNPVMSTTIVTATSDHTLSAVYEGKTCTVSFNRNSQLSVIPFSRKNVTFGQPYGELPVGVPKDTKTTKFVGWYDKSSGGSEVLSSTIVKKESNHTLYARYKEITIKVSWYDTNPCFVASSNDGNAAITNKHYKSSDGGKVYEEGGGSGDGNTWRHPNNDGGEDTNVYKIVFTATNDGLSATATVLVQYHEQASLSGSCTKYYTLYDENAKTFIELPYMPSIHNSTTLTITFESSFFKDRATGTCMVQTQSELCAAAAFSAETPTTDVKYRDGEKIQGWINGTGSASGHITVYQTGTRSAYYEHIVV